MATSKLVHFSETKEFYDLLAAFEKIYSYLRLDKESKSMYRNGAFYQNGEANHLFKAFMHGYQVGRITYMS